MKSDFKYLRSNGEFAVKNPELTRNLYLPLVNSNGFISSVTPLLGGDCKTGQNTFALPPVSIYELHNNRSTRNFWVYFKEKRKKWSASGVSSYQLAEQIESSKEQTELTSGILWHRISRQNPELGISSEITSYVPASGEMVELTKITIKNIGEKELCFKPYSAIPLFGRSADNLRDHRHVTSLLHRCTVNESGIELKPTLYFDERGHKQNNISYGVFCVSSEGLGPVAACPSVDKFLGPGGTFENPVSIGGDFSFSAGDTVDGEEIIAALQMKDEALKPGESKSYILGLCIYEDKKTFCEVFDKFSSVSGFEKGLEDNCNYWKHLLEINFETGDEYSDGWLKWVSLQPVLRRICGNSFMPHYDYGRGGRGWRDLWQDCLSLLLMRPESVRQNMIDFFAGVRTDGSNATVIGDRPGEFVVDRNGITRVWMDHAVWPFFTVMLYISQTDDISILFEKQVYFKDKLTHRCKRVNNDWDYSSDHILKCKNGETYYGTVFEHLLVENLAAVYSVGEHNILRLEDGDWNDALDMANKRGESVAFTCFYYYNLRRLSELCKRLTLAGNKLVSVSAALLKLINSKAVTVEDKQRDFSEYLDICESEFTDNAVDVELSFLANSLEEKAKHLYDTVNGCEWLNLSDDCGWYNSYYDNVGVRSDNCDEQEIRMLLTGQVYAIMSGIADDKRIKSIINAADRYLYTDNGGYRLNTEFPEPDYNFGRMFGFAYGTKENGAVFSHMAVMFSYALYLRGYAAAGFKVINSIYRSSKKFDVSGIYPGIPEYFTPDGHADYPYLTGSASWLMFVMLTQSYGLRGEYGVLLIEPKLMPEQFGPDGCAAASFVFKGRKFKATYKNPERKSFGEYKISAVYLDGVLLAGSNDSGRFSVQSNLVSGLSEDDVHRLEIELR